MAPAASWAAPLRTYNITFDGYCDGLQLIFPSAGLGNSQTVDGHQTGCVAGPIFGQAATDKTEGFVTIPGFQTFTDLHENHTWTHYGLIGNQIYIVNSGTWSFGSPIANRGLPSNTPRAGLATPFRPTTTTDILFDGYCDGMELISPSQGLGTPGTVDGNRTGCASDPLMGATSNINSMNAFAVTFNNDQSGMWIQTGIFSDHTWIHYSNNGNQIYVLNSGTWSFAAAAHAGTSRSTG